MSNCIKKCRLCKRLILSTAITFDGTNLVVNLPANAYGNCEKYCIVFAQTIPDETTINAPVVFTIGTGATLYPFVNCNCSPILASQVRTRTKYAVKVSTTVNDGIFKYIGDCKLPNNSTTIASSLPIEETAVNGTAEVVAFSNSKK